MNFGYRKALLPEHWTTSRGSSNACSSISFGFTLKLGGIHCLAVKKLRDAFFPTELPGTKRRSGLSVTIVAGPS
jgi:hypothetical protein